MDSALMKVFTHRSDEKHPEYGTDDGSDDRAGVLGRCAWGGNRRRGGSKCVRDPKSVKGDGSTVGGNGVAVLKWVESISR